MYDILYNITVYDIIETMISYDYDIIELETMPVMISHDHDIIETMIS